MDRANTYPPFLYVFGKRINKKLVYIKINLKGESEKIVVCVVPLCEQHNEFPVCLICGNMGGERTEESKLISKVRMRCPLCGKEHEIEERMRTAGIIIKEDEVFYEETFYCCPNMGDEENEFEMGPMINKNLMNARNAYRRKHGLLTSDEIVSIREKYGLSQVDLARLLGWGEATIARYESKAIQDEAYDTMLRLIRDNPLEALELLKKHSDRLSAKKAVVQNRIIEQLDSYGKEFLARQKVAAEYARYTEPCDDNGFTVLNISKTEAAISYFAESISNLNKVKLMKMLWYADVVSYKIWGNSITGMVYRHEAMGALPIGHYSLMNLEKLNIQEEEREDGCSMFHILPSKGMDYSILSTQEAEILDKIITAFRPFNAHEIVEYMHRERAYKETRSGEIIPFSLAADLREF